MNITIRNQEEAEKVISRLLTEMYGLSEDGFKRKMLNDPYFRSGFYTLCELFIEAKFK